MRLGVCLVRLVGGKEGGGGGEGGRGGAGEREASMPAHPHNKNLILLPSLFFFYTKRYELPPRYEQGIQRDDCQGPRARVLHHSEKRLPFVFQYGMQAQLYLGRSNYSQGLP